MQKWQAGNFLPAIKQKKFRKQTERCQPIVPGTSSSRQLGLLNLSLPPFTIARSSTVVRCFVRFQLTAIEDLAQPKRSACAFLSPSTSLFHSATSQLSLRLHPLPGLISVLEKTPTPCFEIPDLALTYRLHLPPYRLLIGFSPLPLPKEGRSDADVPHDKHIRCRPE